MKEKIITIVIIVTLLLISFGVNPVSGLKTINNRTSQIEKYNDEAASIILTGSLSVDLKVRKSGDTGWLDSITAQVGNTLEFKIEISSTEGKIAVTIQFPYIGDNVMLNYVLGSASVTPFLVVSEAIVWLFIDIPPSEITFRAKIKKAGTESVNLIAGSTEDTELEDENSVQITGEEKDSIVFHLFTFLNTRRFFFFSLKSTYSLPAIKLIASNLPTRALQDF